MLERIVEIVRKASHLMENSPTEISRKGNDSNYVTSVDVDVQRFLRAKLDEMLPGSAFVCEEEDRPSPAAEYTWVIDPIDGTSNFIRGLGLSVISVGLLKHGKPHMGVIYFPYRDEMYTAEEGCGAFLNGKRIHVSDRDFAHAHLCSAMSLYDKSLAPACFRIIERIYNRSDDLRRLGSAALELAYLAAGRVELYFEIRVFVWDVAAAVLIVREAGGFIEYLFHEELPLDRPFGIIAANSAANFRELHRIVRDELPDKLY